MDTERISVTNNTATISCPACGLAKTVSLENFKNPEIETKIRCLCEHVFQICFDFRVSVRKYTELNGVYINYSKDNDMDKILVKNISKEGIGFLTRGRHRIEKDHRLKVEFALDDENQSTIIKEAVVKVVQEKYIGCVFIPIKDFDFDSPLGFYLGP